LEPITKQTRTNNQASMEDPRFPSLMIIILDGSATAGIAVLACLDICGKGRMCVDWERLMICFIVLFTLVAPLRDRWLSSSLYEVAPHSVWSGDTRSDFRFLCLGRVAIMVGCSLLLLLKSCWLWVLPVSLTCGYVSFYSWIGSPFADTQFKTFYMLVCIGGLSWSGAFQNE